jgi:hypothetical protein
MRGDKIAPYSGKHIVSRDPDFGGPYVLETSHQHYIDAAETTSGAGRFANDAKRPSGNNAKLTIGHPHHGAATANLVASKGIRANSEILTAYGPQYWRVHGH